MIALDDFSEYIKGKSFDEILHEGRKESAERILSEAIVPLALLLSHELLKLLLLPPSEAGTHAPAERTQ